MRIRIDVSYDGGPFHGWAAQPGLPTVEGAIRAGLETILRRPVSVVVAGRTDTGVHARHQVLHCDISVEEHDRLITTRSLEIGELLTRRLNGALKHQAGALYVHRVAVVESAFDARFSAVSRQYSYRIADRRENWDPLRRFDTSWHPRALDATKMRHEAISALGLQDFGSFCKPREHASTIRDLHSFVVEREPDGVIRVELTADAFCHHMVRALIGGCMDVGEGRREPGWLALRLQDPVWDHRVRLAPPHGLVLEAVQYPEASQYRDRAEQTRAHRATENT